MKNLFIFIILVTSLFSQEYYYYKNTQKISLKKLSSTSRAQINIDYYTNDKGLILGVSDKIVVKLKLHDNLEKYLKMYDLHIEKIISKNLYLLGVKDKSVTLEISNTLNQQEDVIYAQPDFIKKSLRR